MLSLLQNTVRTTIFSFIVVNSNSIIYLILTIKDWKNYYVLASSNIHKIQGHFANCTTIASFVRIFTLITALFRNF